VLFVKHFLEKIRTFFGRVATLIHQTASAIVFPVGAIPSIARAIDPFVATATGEAVLGFSDLCGATAVGTFNHSNYLSFLITYIL
jgi:hypothetical protein